MASYVLHHIRGYISPLAVLNLVNVAKKHDIQIKLNVLIEPRRTRLIRVSIGTSTVSKSRYLHESISFFRTGKMFLISPGIYLRLSCIPCGVKIVFVRIQLLGVSKNNCFPLLEGDKSVLKLPKKLLKRTCVRTLAMSASSVFW